MPGLSGSVFFGYTKIMGKSITVKPKRGRPATGRDPLVGVRIPAEVITALDKWAKDEGVSRSEAIRRLIESAIESKRKQ
jgi:hypothetical protein